MERDEQRRQISDLPIQIAGQVPEANWLTAKSKR